MRTTSRSRNATTATSDRSTAETRGNCYLFVPSLEKSPCIGSISPLTASLHLERRDLTLAGLNCCSHSTSATGGENIHCLPLLQAHENTVSSGLICRQQNKSRVRDNFCATLKVLTHLQNSLSFLLITQAKGNLK